MSEKSRQRAIRDCFEQKGAWVVKFHASPYSEVGVPDLLVCYQGRFIGAEVKEPGKYPTQRQRLQMQRIRQAGGIAEVVRSVDDAETLCKDAERANAS